MIIELMQIYLTQRMPVAVQKVFAGKDYNKAMRAHKLTVQALWRILIPLFLKFLQYKKKNW